MRLIITSDQSAQIEPHMRHGWTLLAKLELGAVPSSSLPALRAAIVKATAPKATAPKKPKQKSEQ